MAVCLKDAIQRRSPCVVSQRKSRGHREGWLMALAWADLRDRSVILSTLWRGYNKLMSLWRALVYSCLKEFIFSSGGYVLDLCLSCSWILSHVHRTLHINKFCKIILRIKEISFFSSWYKGSGFYSQKRKIICSLNVFFHIFKYIWERMSFSVFNNWKK